MEQIKIYGELTAATADKCLADAKQIAGGYMALTTAERTSLTSALLVDGMRVYDTDLKADFRYTDGKWVEITDGSGTTDYDKLNNKPIQNQDLSLDGFEPVDNTYYRHTGETTGNFTQGIIYLYTTDGYKAIDGSGSGGSGIEGTTINGTSVPAVSNKSAIVTDGKSILYEDSGSGENKLKLPDDWITYLEEKAYLDPTLTLGGVAGQTVEYGVTASISNNFTHNETYIKNISGTLNLLRNGTAVVTDIAPSESSTSIAYEKTETITEHVTYRLQGTNSKSGAIYSNSVVFNCYKPVFYGASSSETLESTTGLTKRASASFGTITVTTEANQYVYFLTTGTISAITSGGFAVPYEKTQTLVVTINDLELTYNVYRTDKLEAGDNTFVVSQ